MMNRPQKTPNDSSNTNVEQKAVKSENVVQVGIQYLTQVLGSNIGVVAVVAIVAIVALVLFFSSNPLPATIPVIVSSATSTPQGAATNALTNMPTVTKTPSPVVTAIPTPPWISMTENNLQVNGQIGPSSFCNENYKVVVYAYTDLWYIQPVDDGRSNISLNLNGDGDCVWHTATGEWDRLAAHLVAADFVQPGQIDAVGCPPLTPNSGDDVLAAFCIP